MTAEFVVYLLAGAAAGGFINGLAGFGTSLMALGWWLQVMPPVQAVAISLIMSVASGIQGVVLVRRAIDARRLARFLIPAIIGIPIGLQLLRHVDGGVLKLVIAGFMLLYGGFFAFRRDLPSIERPTPLIDGLVGFAGGVLGAVAGVSGALPTMWLALHDWAKEKSRAVLQPFNVAVLAVAAILLAVNGAYDRGTLIAIAVAAPANLIASRIGIFVFKRLSDGQFRRLLVALMLLAGAVLLAKEIV